MVAGGCEGGNVFMGASLPLIASLIALPDNGKSLCCKKTHLFMNGTDSCTLEDDTVREGRARSPERAPTPGTQNQGPRSSAGLE